MYRLRFINLGITVLATLLVASGCGSEPPPPPPLPPAPPLATPVIKLLDSQVEVDRLPDVIEARQQLAQWNYAAGVRALTHALASYPNNPQLNDLLAQAYLDWGLASMTAEGSRLKGRSLAVDRFSSGLAVVSSEELRTRLRSALSESIVYLRLEKLRERLTPAVEQGWVGNDLLDALKTIPGDVDLLLAQNSADPVLRDLASTTLLLGGQAFLVRGGGEAAEQAKIFCTRARELGAGDPATRCIEAARRQLATPTSVVPIKPPTRTPAPTATPPPLPRLEVPDMRGADVGRTRQYLREDIGFTGEIVVTEVDQFWQISGMCRQGVLYTSPLATSRVPANTLIRIFYRGSVNAPGLPDCDADRLPR